MFGYVTDFNRVFLVKKNSTNMEQKLGLSFLRVLRCGKHLDWDRLLFRLDLLLGLLGAVLHYHRST